MNSSTESAIGKFSLFFIKRWRVSLLLLISIVSIGLFTYQYVLKRESMPPIDIPIGVVNTPYFVGDQDKVNKDITIPLEKVLSAIPEVNQVTSYTSDNFSTVVIEFNLGVTSEDGMKIVRNEVNAASIYSDNIEPIYQVYDAGKIDAIHDMLFTLTGEGKTIKELQVKADEISKLLEKNENISTAEGIDVIKEEVNPITGEKFENTAIISRFGIKENDQLVFGSAIYIGVNKKSDDIGSIELSDSVREEIKKMEESGVLDGYKVNYSIGDMSVMLKDEINGLQENALEAIIIVLILICIIVNWRASIVTVIFIPTVMAATFLGFMVIGYTINTMTLFAFILVLGLFVDDAIVVVEAIDAQKQKGKKGIDAVARAMKKVGVADTAGTLTTMMVFVPMAFISGIMGDFIRIMPVTVILALGLSLVIALSIIPFLSNVIITDISEKKRTGVFKIIDNIMYGTGRAFNEGGVYVSKFVNYYLSRPIIGGIVFIVSIVLIIIGASFAGKLPFDVFPPAKDSNAIEISVTFPEGTTIVDAEGIAKQIESDIKDKYNDVVDIVNYFQADETGISYYVELKDYKSRDITSKQIADGLNEEFEKYTTARVKARQSSIGAPQTDYPFQMQVFSDNSEQLANVTQQIRSEISGIQVTDDVKVEDVLVENLLTLSKIDGRQYALVKAKMTKSDNSSGDLETLKNKVKDIYTKEKLEQMGLSEDSITYDFGEQTQLMESFNSAIIGMLVTMVILYGLLIFQFNSFTKPLLVFLGIPMSFPLLFPGLYATDNQLSFFTVLGLTALIGIMANNIIMLLDFARMRSEDEGKNPREAIVGAIKRRFRPLVATTTITVSGLLPLAISDPFWAPFALTIIFGLISCTTLLIFAFPVYYYILENLRIYVKKGLRKIKRIPGKAIGQFLD